MYSLRYSNKAEADLEEAIFHIAKESVTNAINYLSGYEDKIELLQDNPYMGVRCENKLIHRNAFILNCFIIFFFTCNNSKYQKPRRPTGRTISW